MYAAVTLQDVLSLLQDRHGGPCAGNNGAMFLQAAIPPLAVIAGGIDTPEFANRVLDWAQAYAPGIGEAQIRAILMAARERDAAGRLMTTAADLGALLELTTDERERLAIKMARPAGMTDAEFARYQRRRAVERKRQRREEDGASSRMQSIARTRPWVAEGISRAAWYRRRPGGAERREQAMPRGTVGTDFETRETSSAEHNSPTVRPNLSQAVPRPWEAAGISRRTWYRQKRDDASRANCSTLKRRRPAAASGKPANDNSRLKPWQPKRGRRVAIVGGVNDNTGDD